MSRQIAEETVAPPQQLMTTLAFSQSLWSSYWILRNNLKEKDKITFGPQLNYLNLLFATSPSQMGAVVPPAFMDNPVDFLFAVEALILALEAAVRASDTTGTEKTHYAKALKAIPLPPYHRNNALVGLATSALLVAGFAAELVFATTLGLPFAMYVTVMVMAGAAACATLYFLGDILYHQQKMSTLKHDREVYVAAVETTMPSAPEVAPVPFEKPRPHERSQLSNIFASNDKKINMKLFGLAATTLLLVGGITAMVILMLYTHTMTLSVITLFTVLFPAIIFLAMASDFLSDLRHQHSQKAVAIKGVEAEDTTQAAEKTVSAEREPAAVKTVEPTRSTHSWLPKTFAALFHSAPVAKTPSTQQTPAATPPVAANTAPPSPAGGAP